MTTEITTPKSWSLIELKHALLFLRSLFMTGLSPAEALDEIAILQPKRAEFWKAGAVHCRGGKPLHEYLHKRWPANLVSPIQIAEASGRLDDVFAGMEQTLQQQIDTRKLLKKLIMPIAIACGGVGAAIFFISYVIPTMVGKLRFAREPAIISFAKSAQMLVNDYGYYALGGLIVTLLLGLFKWHEDEDFRATLLAKLDSVPVLGWATRWLWFSVWAKYAAIMMRADIAITDPMFRTTLATLPPHLRASIQSVIVQIDRGQSLSNAVTPGKASDDPRHQLPIHIRNAFRMTDRSGQGGKQFQLASQTLFEPGSEVLSVAIATINQAMIVVSATMILVPFALYIKTIAGVTQSLGH